MLWINSLRRIWVHLLGQCAHRSDEASRCRYLSEEGVSYVSDFGWATGHGVSSNY